MNIQTVIDNLKRTIMGKEKLLEALHPNNPYTEGFMDEVQVMVRKATIEFLKLNINELKRILKDVEQCAKQASDDSWITNPDRSGGQFSQDEINDSGSWK